MSQIEYWICPKCEGTTTVRYSEAFGQENDFIVSSLCVKCNPDLMSEISYEIFNAEGYLVNSMKSFREFATYIRKNPKSGSIWGGV